VRKNGHGGLGATRDRSLTGRRGDARTTDAWDNGSFDALVATGSMAVPRAGVRETTSSPEGPPMTAAGDRHLLFGLLALQNAIINQGQLVAAFQASEGPCVKGSGGARRSSIGGRCRGQMLIMRHVLADDPDALIVRAYWVKRGLASAE
jgi:hypothetical protein